jgi:hypothetical protein
MTEIKRPLPTVSFKRIASYMATTPRLNNNIVDVAQAQVKPETPGTEQLMKSEGSGGCDKAISASLSFHSTTASPPT